MAPLLDCRPVDALEEGMLSDGVGIINGRSYSLTEVAQSPCRISLQELGQKRLGFSGEFWRHGDLEANDVLQHLLFILSLVERRSPTEHLVNNGAETPPITFVRMTFAKNHFGSQVLRSSAKRIGLLPRLNSHFGETEVGDLDVARCIEQNVFWLEVAVDDSVGMQVSQCLDQFRRIDPNSVLFELLFRSQVRKHLTAIQEVDDEIQFGFGLEGKVQPNNVRVLRMLQDFSLGLSFDEQIFLQQLILLENFHRVMISRVFFHDEVDFSEATSADDFLVFEVGSRDLFLRFQQILRVESILHLL